MSKITIISIISAVVLSDSVLNAAESSKDEISPSIITTSPNTYEALQQVSANLQQAQEDMKAVRDAMNDVNQAMSEVRVVADKFVAITEQHESSAKNYSWFSGWY